MKIKMDINRWRTSADVSVLECEPMYAGSMYVHKLFVESNLYENEVLQAEFRVGGKKVAQASLLYKGAVDGQFALYEALIPSKLFKTHAPKQVDVVIGLFKSNDGVLSSILITQAQSFIIEGEGDVFENGMDEDERELFNENLVHLTGKINEFNDIVKNNEDNISNIKEKVSNFKVGEIIAKSSESGAEPKVEAEIVDSETPNEFKLNMNFTLPRGEQGKPGEVTGAVVGVKGNAETEYRQGSVILSPANIGLGQARNIFNGQTTVRAIAGENGYAVIISLDKDSRIASLSDIKNGDLLRIYFIKSFNGNLTNSGIESSSGEILPINLFFDAKGSDVSIPSEVMILFTCFDKGAFVALTQPSILSDIDSGRETLLSYSSTATGITTGVKTLSTNIIHNSLLEIVAISMRSTVSYTRSYAMIVNSDSFLASQSLWEIVNNSTETLRILSNTTGNQINVYEANNIAFLYIYQIKRG